MVLSTNLGEIIKMRLKIVFLIALLLTTVSPSYEVPFSFTGVLEKVTIEVD